MFCKQMYQPLCCVYFSKVRTDSVCVVQKGLLRPVFWQVKLLQCMNSVLWTITRQKCACTLYIISQLLQNNVKAC